MLVCAVDINLLGDSINTIQENTESLWGASRDIGLEINAEKTKYMVMSRHPNSGQNQNIRIANESFGNVAEFKYAHGGGEWCLQGFSWEVRRKEITGKT
jgi:hypothetical protein